jgi:predicted kinase
VIAERLRRRSAANLDASDADLAVHRRLAAEDDPFTPDEARRAARSDAGQAPEEVVLPLLDRLERPAS